MTELFIGIIFIVIDVMGVAGSARIALLPDFIGYALVWHALGRSTFARIDKLRKAALVMTPISLVIFVAEILGVSGALGGYAGHVLDAALTVCGLGASSLAVSMIREEHAITPEQGKRMFTAWTIMMVFSLLSFLSIAFKKSAMLFIVFCLAADINYIVLVGNGLKSIKKGNGVVTETANEPSGDDSLK